MPKINANAQEQTENSVGAAVQNNSVDIVSKPVLTCGVNRKINTGNFENIDVYAALTIPLSHMPESAMELERLVREAAEIGFNLTSRETGERYDAVKAMQKAGRQ